MLSSANCLPPSCLHSLDKLGLLRHELRISRLLVLIMTSFLTAYYLAGATFLPSIVLLLLVAQVLSSGISTTCSIVLDLMARRAQKKPVSIDRLTAFFIDLETRLGGSFNWNYLVFHGLARLLLTVTPEVLVTFLGNAVVDVRPLASVHTKVRLGCFGGAFNESTYWTSGLTLLNARNPDVEFREIAYKNKAEWIVPRIPVVWYEKYAQFGKHENYCSYEKQIYVEKNPAVAVTRTTVRNKTTCWSEIYSDFGYNLTIFSCPCNRFGFSIGGPTLRENTTFFHLRKGSVSVRYKSTGRARIMSQGSLLQNGTAIQFPRIKNLSKEMGPCFLNAISFHRPVTQIPIMERLAIASIVRIAALESPSGFDDPPSYVEASVSDVRVSNLSKFSLITASASALAIILRIIYTFAMGGLLFSSALSDIIPACSSPGLTEYIQDMNQNGACGLFQSLKVRVSPDETNHNVVFIRHLDDEQEQLHSDVETSIT